MRNRQAPNGLPDGIHATARTRKVLQAALAQPTREWYALHLCRSTGLLPGMARPTLARLERHGWIGSRWEEPSEHKGGHRRRRYWFTSEGERRARELVGGE